MHNPAKNKYALDSFLLFIHSLMEYIKTKGNINQVYMNIDRKILTKNENTITKPPRKIKIILCFIDFF